jgi:hypothetical protein
LDPHEGMYHLVSLRRHNNTLDSESATSLLISINHMSLLKRDVTHLRVPYAPSEAQTLPGRVLECDLNFEKLPGLVALVDCRGDCLLQLYRASHAAE